MLPRILYCLLCLLFNSPSSIAQDQPPGLRLTSVSRTMHGRLQPGGWLVLTAKVTNTSQTAAVARVLVTIPGATGVQSSRTLSIPARTQEDLDVHVQVPESVQTLTATEVEVSLYEVDGNQERLLDLNGVPMRTSLRLQVEQDKNMVFTCINDEPVEQWYWQWPFREDYHNYEIVVASRVSSGNTRNTVSFDNLNIPLTRADWDSIGMVVISEANFFDDAAAVQALSEFVNQGGRAWIMLDQIPTHLVQQLLAQGQSCEEVDVVELNSFSVKVTEVTQLLADDDLLVSRDEPVLFKRLVHSGGRASHTIDGWPAALWMNVGYGELLLTTLASAAWLQPGTESDDPQQQTNFKMTAWAASLAQEVNESRRPPPLSTAVSYPLELVGNPVLPRPLAAIALFSFVSLLVASGALYFKIGNLSRFGLVAPLLSILFGGGMLLSSTWVRRDIPETLSRLQLIQVSQDGQTALVREQSAVHLSSERSMALQGSVDGFATADTTVQSGIKRFDVQDINQWELTNVAWPTGLWRYRSTHMIETAPLVATAHLTADGVHIALPASIDAFSDPIIGFTPGGSMIGETRGAGHIFSDGQLMAEADRWISGTLITDEQRRRIDVYRRFFSDDNRQLAPRRTVYGWTPPWEGVAWDASGFSHVGSAMVGLPLRLIRPPVGETILLPTGLVELQKDTQRLAQTSVYNSQTGKWSPGLTLAIEANLQFVLPREVLPFKAESLGLELAIKAPHRRVRVLHSSTDGSEPIEIVTLDGPSVPWHGVVTDPGILDDAVDGVIGVTVEVSERTDVQADVNSGTVVTWQIDAFRASLTGSRISASDQQLAQ